VPSNYVPRKFPRSLLLSDKILCIYSAEGPKTNPELAELLGRSIGCIRTTNTFNRSMGFSEPIGSPRNRAAGDVKFQITDSGKERLQSLNLAKAISDLVTGKVQP
jgi:hypothetical protein